MNFSEISNDENNRNHRSFDLKSRVANTELQLKYLACAHIDLKNELAVLHQMVKKIILEIFFLNIYCGEFFQIQRLLDESLLNKVDQQVSNENSNNIDETNRILNKVNQQLFDNNSRKSSPIVESDYDNTTVIEDPDK